MHSRPQLFERARRWRWFPCAALIAVAGTQIALTIFFIPNGFGSAPARGTSHSEFAEKTVAEQEENIKRLRVVEEAERTRQAVVINAEAEAQEALVKDIKAAEAAEAAAKFKAREELLARPGGRSSPRIRLSHRSPLTAHGEVTGQCCSAKQSRTRVRRAQGKENRAIFRSGIAAHGVLVEPPLVLLPARSCSTGSRCGPASCTQSRPKGAR